MGASSAYASASLALALPEPREASGGPELQPPGSLSLGHGEGLVDAHALGYLRQALWTFVHLEGVEPTNNTAERAIRPGVLWHKGSFGTHSAQGSRFVEALMTVITTLKQQQRDVLEYLTAACAATLHDAPAPSLLPTSQVAPADQVAA